MPPNEKDVDAFLDSLVLDWTPLVDQVTPLLVADSEAAAENQLILAGIIQPKDRGFWTTVLPEIKAASRTRAAELIGMKVLPNGTIGPNPDAKWSITETTRDRLKTTLNQAIDEGWTANETQSAIMESEAFSPARALNIARTESAFARGRGSRIAARAAKMGTKEWLLGTDPCDDCLANAGQGKIPIDEEFQSGDMNEPAHPSCRCTVVYYPEEVIEQ